MVDKAPASKLPPGYKDEDEFLSEMRDYFNGDSDADRVNRDAALDDQRFAANFENMQWDPAVLVQRAGRPCLTTNVLPQYINQVVGDSIINRPSIKVRPAEDADQDLAEIREGVIRAIEYQSDATRVYTRSGQAQVTCGRGFFRVGLAFAGNDTFDRDIRISLIPDALSVVVDAMSFDPSAKDAKRIFVNDLVPKKEFERRFPDAQPSELDPGVRSQLMARGWFDTDTVRVTEYWKMVEEEIELGLTQEGKTEIVKPGVSYQDTRKTKRERPWMWLTNGFKILEGPHKVPLDRIPVFKVTGQEFWVGPARVTFGLVRFLKDEQRLQNYADSVIAETLATTPKIMWTAEASAVENREEQFRNAHRTNDPLLVYNDGFKAPERADQFIFPTGLLTWRQMLTQSMKDVSGLHDASLGIQSNETSGKAIMARQREGDVATIVYHDNLNYSIAECGRVCNQLIPVVYDTARTIRIVGEDQATKVIRINDPNDPESVDVTGGKYDIVVDTGPSYATKRVEAAESMLAFVQAVPTAGAVAGDLIASAQDWPMAQEIGDRLKKSLPPGIVDVDPESLSPEEQQQMEQAQAQQQQEAEQAKALALATAEADLEYKAAQTAKLEAEAKKIENEASGPGATDHDLAMQAAELATAQANARKAEAEADKAESEALSVHMGHGVRKNEAEVRAAEAAAARAEIEAADAEVNSAFNDADKDHRITHGRGIDEPEPAPVGAEA